MVRRISHFCSQKYFFCSSEPGIDRFCFAATVATFGQSLQGGGQYHGTFSYNEIFDLAQSAQNCDSFRATFLNLIK